MHDEPIGSLLETKLAVPRLRPEYVERDRLVHRLDSGVDTRLTLVSAPAGSGKTTLLAGWATGRPVGWYSIDRGDNDRVTFWSHVVAALRTAVPDVGNRSMALLRDPGVPPERFLIELLNELDAGPSEVWLVLDDFHLIEAVDVEEDMAFIVSHLPANSHVVITTRSDPALPLAGLRARGDLTEIRAADLRFSAEEAEAYLNEQMALGLSSVDVDTLERRTEGWIAALQLAALSMRGRDDASRFIEGFAGSQRYIVDYLVEEVLGRLDARTRSFLIETSILPRLSGPLCDTVTGGSDGQATIESLERQNLFIVPLDDHRRWYRYHQLFADVLGARLVDEQPGRVPELHLRASEWFEADGDRSAAIHHALRGGHSERAAALVERSIPALRRDRQEKTLRRWCEALPRDIVDARPVLGIGYVGALLADGHVDGVGDLLGTAELALTTGAAEDAEELRRMPSAIAMYQAALARIAGDDQGTIDHATRARELATPDDDLVRGGATGLIALTHWTRGDLDEAFDAWATAAGTLERAGHLSDVLGCSIAMADIRITQGRLDDAMAIYRRGRALAGGDDILRGAPDMHVGMGGILAERNDLAGAREQLDLATRLGDELGLPQNRYRTRTVDARIRQSQGDAEGALDAWREAESAYFTDFAPEVRPPAASAARLCVAMGRQSDAMAWVDRSGLSISDEPVYIREYEHVTLARVLVADSVDRGDPTAVPAILAFLERLRTAADDGGRIRTVVEVSIVEALAHEAVGDTADALTALGRAIELAAPEGHIGVFADDTRKLEPLLRRLADGSPNGHARRVLAALPRDDRTQPRRQPIDPLTDRELEVLRFLGGDATGPEIARELYVSVNTLRTHTKSIYTKLGVTSRRAAVRRASDLGLI